MRNSLETTRGGIVLSGGKSKRMGKEKGLCHFRGKTLISYAIDLLSPLCDELFLSANNKINQYKLLNYQVICDETPGIGPIGGLYSCLKKSVFPVNLVISCDTPFVTNDVFFKLLEFTNDYQAIVPIHENGFTEPLTACYHRSSLPIIEAQISCGNYKMTDLLKKLHTKFVPINSIIPGLKTSLFHNLNSEEDMLSC